MTDPTVVRLLGEILEQLQALNASQKPRRSLSHADHVVLDRLLPAIVGRFGHQVVFTTRDVLADSGLQLLVPHLDARGVGVLLSAACGQDVGLYRVFKVETLAHGAACWGVEALGRFN